MSCVENCTTDNDDYQSESSDVVIKVIAVGGGGGNLCKPLIEDERLIKNGIEFIFINTDAQALQQLEDKALTIKIGYETRGLGAGGDPNIGRRAALESRAEIEEAIIGTDLLFIAAGLGGGTGSGAVPVVAEIAKNCGILSFGTFTTPFAFEGTKRMKTATEAIEQLREVIDSYVIMPNEKLLDNVEMTVLAEQALQLANISLLHAIVGITDTIRRPGIINIDFSDVKAILQEAGQTYIGYSVEVGKVKAVDACQYALSAMQLVDITLKQSTRLLLNITGGSDLTFKDITEVSKLVYELGAPNSNVIFGATVDEGMQGQVSITVVASGFPSDDARYSSPTITQQGIYTNHDNLLHAF